MTVVMRSPIRRAIRRRPRGPAQSMWGEDDGLYRGPNITTGGDFGSTAGWVLGTGWAIVGGVATAVAATGALTHASASIRAGGRYLVQFDLLALSLGGLRISAGGGVSANLLTVGTKQIEVKATADGSLAIQPVGTFTGSIDNLVVREIFE